MDNEIMKGKELASYLRIPIRTLYKLCNEGKIPCKKVGRHWRFRKSDVDRWFDAGSNAQTRLNLGPDPLDTIGGRKG